jgi:hypothetical protein
VDWFGKACAVSGYEYGSVVMMLHDFYNRSGGPRNRLINRAAGPTLLDSYLITVRGKTGGRFCKARFDCRPFLIFRGGKKLWEEVFPGVAGG